MPAGVQCTQREFSRLGAVALRSLRGVGGSLHWNGLGAASAGRAKVAMAGAKRRLAGLASKASSNTRTVSAKISCAPFSCDDGEQGARAVNAAGRSVRFAGGGQANRARASAQVLLLLLLPSPPRSPSPPRPRLRPRLRERRSCLLPERRAPCTAVLLCWPGARLVRYSWLRPSPDRSRRRRQAGCTLSLGGLLLRRGRLLLVTEQCSAHGRAWELFVPSVSKRPSGSAALHACPPMHQPCFAVVQNAAACVHASSSSSSRCTG